MKSDQTESGSISGQAPAATPEVSRPRFSEELERLIAAFASRAVRLGDVLEVMQSRGYTVLLILLTFPFCTPLPLPGVSVPFGLAIALIGLRLALGQNPWLPRWILDRRLPSSFFPRFLSATRRLVRWFEFLLKPRLAHMLRFRLVKSGIGAMIFVSGLLMMLPFPIPFSNGLPAMTVLLLASAILEEDGYFAIAGTVSFLISLAFFAAVFWGGAEVAGVLRDLFGNLLRPDDAPAR